MGHPRAGVLGGPKRGRAKGRKTPSGETANCTGWVETRKSRRKRGHHRGENGNFGEGKGKRGGAGGKVPRCKRQ